MILSPQYTNQLTQPNNPCESGALEKFREQVLAFWASTSPSPERSIQVQPSGLFPPSTIVIPVRRFPPPLAPLPFVGSYTFDTGNRTSSLLEVMAGLMGKQRVPELSTKAKTPCPRPFSNSVRREPCWCASGPPSSPPPWCLCGAAQPRTSRLTRECSSDCSSDASLNPGIEQKAEARTPGVWPCPRPP